MTAELEVFHKSLVSRKHTILTSEIELHFRVFLSVSFCLFCAKSLNILHPCLSLSESTVPGYWSCGTPTSSFARGRQTLAAKTHAWDWYFECTSTSPTAGQCPCRLPPTPSNAVSHRYNSHTGGAFWEQRAKAGFCCLFFCHCSPRNGASWSYELLDGNKYLFTC